MDDIWNRLIDQESQSLSKHLSELDISALYDCIGDCYGSFNEIYFTLLKKLDGIALNNYDALHDCVVDIYWQFDHIKKHISVRQIS